MYWMGGAKGHRLQDKDRDSGFGIGNLEGFREKWKGNSPSPLILSLDGARKTKEKGYRRPQARAAAQLR